MPRDINDILPKIEGMAWGAVTNMEPTVANLRYLLKAMPHDEKWHAIFESPESVHIDGREIRRRTADSMT